VASLLYGLAAWAQDPDAQRAFVEGARLLQAGDYDGAARTFRAVLESTGAPRVKLELARALFHQKKYDESRALFEQVLADPDLPWQVRDNIEAFIRAIEKAQGYLKFAISLVTDSNPRSLNGQREFTIAGLPLTFRPPADNKRVTGLRYAVQGFQPLLPEQRLSGYFTGSYIDYPGSSLDRLTVDFGAAKVLDDADGLSVRAGLEAGSFGDQRLYGFPYVAGLATLLQGPRHRVSGEVKLGRVNFTDYPHLDATYKSATVSAIRPLSGHDALSLNTTFEHSKAAERPYSYYGLSVGPGITWLLAKPALQMTTELGLSLRRYAATDPFFGEQRADRKARLDLTARSKQWRWMNYRPALTVSFERNRSNIDFYGYRKVNLSMALE
jgi:tetratricopeptide (TPR) repeat protein